MSRIEELIAQYCPEGVSFRSLGDVVKNLDRLRKPVTKSSRIAGPYAYYGANGIQDYVHDFIFDGTFLLVGEDGSVKNADGTPVLNWATGKIWVNNHAHILQAASDEVELRYLYFYLQTVDISAFVTGGTQPKLNQKNMNSILVAVPPLEVQREIVRVLDQFTQLEAELEAELEARRRQYEHYKQSVLHFDPEAEEVHLGDLVEVLQGFSFKSSMYVDSGIRVVRISDVQKGFVSDKDLKFYPESSSSEFSRYLLSEGDLVMSLSGSVGRVAVLSESDLPAALNQRVACLRPKSNNALTRYLFHFLNTDRFEQSAIASTSGGTVKNISAGWLKDVRIPLPALEEQDRIVSILDKFDALVNDLSIGLPAEIAARRKQYEHYRDKLLTFKELAS